MHLYIPLFRKDATTLGLDTGHYCTSYLA